MHPLMLFLYKTKREYQERPRTLEILAELQNRLYRSTDELFANLLLWELFAGIVVSLLITPETWSGRYSDTHIHVWTAVILGSMICLPPIFVEKKFPGTRLSRYSIAIAQMLFSAMLIHLTGGRIETHFHVFGSLAFLSFYRDWRVLVPATMVVATDHILRGLFFPQSVYGVNEIEPWRWLEHSWWVIFEDVFLIQMCRTSTKDMLDYARRQAEIEEVNSSIEKIVESRTEELNHARNWATIQFDIAKAVSKANSWKDAIDSVLETLTSRIVSPENNRVWAAFWSFNSHDQVMDCVSQVQVPDGDRSLASFLEVLQKQRFGSGEGLPGRAWAQSKAAIALDLQDYEICPRKSCAAESGLKHGVLIPVWYADQFLGTFEFLTKEQVSWDLLALESLGRLVGQDLVRKKTESEREHLARIVKQSSDAIISITDDGKIRSWNKGAELTFIFTEEEASGRELSSILQDKGSGTRELEQVLQFSLRAGERIDAYETSVCNKDGKHVDLVLSAVPWFRESGQYDGCSLTIHDITARKEAETRVGEFYSIVSHELRTPLTSIRGVLGLLENKTVIADSDEGSELIQVARTSADRLIRLINDMLDLKKIEAGKMELKKCKIEATELVSCCLASLSGMAEDYGIRLEQSNSENERGYFVDADWDKATQILTNLVSNAIKFSPRAEKVEVHIESSENKHIRFIVIDNGPGISAEGKAKLFDKFQQLDSSDSRSFGGTGLGLAISRALAEEHGGRIGVISSPSCGSEFWFELPEYDKRTAVRGQEERKEHSAAVLLVEGNEDTASTIRNYLESRRFFVELAASISEAKEMIDSGKLCLNSMLLDLSMPDGCGLELVEHLRKYDEFRDVPIIALNSNGEQSANAGFLDWLSPSIENSFSCQNSLGKIIKEYRRCKVLVVDDDAELRRVLTIQLKSVGLECLEAVDGRQALDLIRTESPDLVMLDLVMPGLDGFGVVEELKLDESRKNLPIVVYSCRDLEAGEKESLNLGLTRYLVKGSSSYEDILETVEDLIQKSGARMSPDFKSRIQEADSEAISRS